MTDDALSRAQALLDEVADDPRLIHLHSSGYVVATINELAEALRAARTENERLRANAADLIERLERASHALDKLASTTALKSQADRLKHKRQGIDLALSCARECQR